MTPALTAGLLSASMVERLVPGRSVLFCTDPGASLLREFGPLVLFHEALDLMGETMVGVTVVKGQLFRPERFRYVGERSDDGWITGSWSENPVPGRMVRCRLTGGHEDEQDWPSERVIWNAPTIIAFRLVEEATPARDSGSSAIEADTHRAAAQVVLARLVSEVESFSRAPDSARVWIGGWSTYSGARDPSLVHVGEVRAALAASSADTQVGTETRERRSAPEAYTTAGVGEGKEDRYRLACEHAGSSQDPLVMMLRSASERLDRSPPDVHGAQVALHGARLAVSLTALAALSPLDVTISDK